MQSSSAAPSASPSYPMPAAAGYVQAAKVNGLAVASLVLGVLWIYWLGSILALILGYVAKRQITQSNGTQSGSGFATAGIVLGWIGVVTILFFAVIVIAGARSSTPSIF